MEEIGFKCQKFSLSLKWQEETNYSVRLFPLLYTKLKGGFL